MKVLFVTLDTLRADRVTCMGGSRGLTPNIDAFASQGAVFTHAIPSDIPTQPSHTALFTGRYGISTQIVSHFYPPAKLPEDEPWLPSIMRAAGRATGAVDHLFVMKDWFIRGYDDYMPPPGRSRSPASVINEMAFPWIDAHADEDFFLFLHYWDPHAPYVPPAEYRDRFTAKSRSWIDPHVTDRVMSRPSYPLWKRGLYDHLAEIPNLDYVADLYDAEVSYLDDQLGRLFDHLDARGILDETLIVLYGDHGENLVEHDAWFDHTGLYESVVRVPLVIRRPGLIPATRVDEMVQLIDVMPTVLDITGAPAPASLDGRSLVPLINGDVSSGREVAFLSECTWQASRGVRTREWKYIRPYDPGLYGRSGPELYHLPSDPCETKNIASNHPDVVDELDRELKRWLYSRLGERPDPMLRVIRDGLPAIARLNATIAEDDAVAMRATGDRESAIA